MNETGFKALAEEHRAKAVFYVGYDDLVLLFRNTANALDTADDLLAENERLQRGLAYIRALDERLGHPSRGCGYGQQSCHCGKYDRRALIDVLVPDPDFPHQSTPAPDAASQARKAIERATGKDQE